MRFLGIYITESLIINSKAMQSSLYDENIKRENEPFYKKHLLLKFSVMSEVWYRIMGCG
jgi:hypothetical protein